MLEQADTTTEGPQALSPPEGSWSVALTGSYSIELERALGGLVALYHAARGTGTDYDALTRAQPTAQRLTQASFAYLHRVASLAVADDAQAHALVWAVLCNDLGKVHRVRRHAQHLQGPDAQVEADHDLLLGLVLQKDAAWLAGFSALSGAQQSQIGAGFLSGSDIAQFSHLEIPAQSLAGLQKLDPDTRQLYFLHSLFDVAGAAAHREARGSFTLTEVTWQIFSDVAASLAHFDDAAKTPQDIFADYAQRRGSRFGILQHAPDGPALQILGAMQRFSTAQEGQWLQEAWLSLEEPTRAILRRELALYRADADGERTIRIAYGPTILVNALTHAPSNRSHAQAIAGGLHLLADVFALARSQMPAAACGQPADQEPILVDARDLAASVRDGNESFESITISQFSCSSATIGL